MPAPDQPRGPAGVATDAFEAATNSLCGRGVSRGLASMYASTVLSAILPILTSAWRAESEAALAETTAAAMAQAGPITDKAIEAATAALATRFPLGDGTFTVIAVYDVGILMLCDRCLAEIYRHDRYRIWLHRLNEEAARHTCPTDTEGTPA